MHQNRDRDKTRCYGSAQILRVERLRQWGELLLRWGWLLFEVVKWLSG